MPTLLQRATVLAFTATFLTVTATTNTIAPAAHSVTPQYIPSPEPGWPQFRGPHRDGVSNETGLLHKWPESGPNLLWSAQGLGRGSSSPIIVNNRLYVTGDSDAELHADNHLYTLCEDSWMLLLRPARSAFEVHGRFQFGNTTDNDAWAHPVILHGRLCLRYHDSLSCYDIRDNH
jgi:hypothetical protein